MDVFYNELNIVDYSGGNFLNVGLIFIGVFYVFSHYFLDDGLNT